MKIKTMSKITEKHIWYVDSDDVSLPFDECIIRLAKNHKFFDFVSIRNVDSTVYVIARKITGRPRSYAMQLVEISEMVFDEDEWTDISYKGRAVCNLGSFQYISEYTQQELKRLAKRKETTKRYGL